MKSLPAERRRGVEDKRHLLLALLPYRVSLSRRISTTLGSVVFGPCLGGTVGGVAYVGRESTRLLYRDSSQPILPSRTPGTTYWCPGPLPLSYGLYSGVHCKQTCDWDRLHGSRIWTDLEPRTGRSVIFLSCIIFNANSRKIGYICFLSLSITSK